MAGTTDETHLVHAKRDSTLELRESPALHPGLPKITELGRLNVLGLQALRALGYIKLHTLPLLQAAESARLDGGLVNKYVSTAVAGDEPVAFGIVEPLHSSLFHVLISLN